VGYRPLFPEKEKTSPSFCCAQDRRLVSLRQDPSSLSPKAVAFGEKREGEPISFVDRSIDASSQVFTLGKEKNPLPLSIYHLR
jgi:hypothetical protein